MEENMNHPIAPVYDRDSQILILGSFPSVKSREQQFFYGHKQNRFWRVMAQVLVVPNDLSDILFCADIREIYANGGKAYQLYQKYIFPVNGREAHLLPSTSPANAGYSLERLVDSWKVIRESLD
ncbi:MAG: uracil-DNA glycosylase family protein [Lachnospiraceae bacterium]|nr:uracil-DNA glycosylase family protein [Lachnospiraceae bacterium]